MFLSKENDQVDEEKASYEYEVTSNAFRVNGDGLLIVTDHLDRDPPNPSTYKIQVRIQNRLILICQTKSEISPLSNAASFFFQQIVARQVGAPPGKGASLPLTLNVHLLDVNDNPPKLPNFSPVQIQAGEGARQVYKVAKLE